MTDRSSTTETSPGVPPFEGLALRLHDQDDIAIAKIHVGNTFAIDIGSVGAGIDNSKAVALAFDAGMTPGDGGHLFFKTNLAGGVPADMKWKLGELLDLPLQRALNVYQLNDDGWHLGHGDPPECVMIGSRLASNCRNTPDYRRKNAVGVKEFSAVSGLIRSCS